MKNLMIDEDIPYLADWLRHAFDITLFHPDKIAHNNLARADAVIVRTLTHINAPWLAQAPQLRFIASATSGIDHIDLQAIEKRGIYFAHAPGCNAKAVGDYVVACFDALGTPKKHRRIGIIGYGHVGQEVAKRFKALEYKVIPHDPIKAQHDPSFQSHPLEDLSKLDALCVHPSLTTKGEFPSLHMIDEALLAQQETNTLVINASRGAVADEQALYKNSDRLSLCLDVWQHEPHINEALLTKTRIATPHIAGYSLSAKWQGSKQVAEAICAYFNIPPPISPPPNLSDGFPLDVLTLDNIWRQAENKPESFQALRQQQTQRL